MKHFIKLAVLTLFLFVAGGCGTSSHITSSWKAQDSQSKRYKKIVVLGLIRDADRTIREKMEQHIVGDLKELGYYAVCSCDEYNPRAFDNMSEKDAVAKLRNSGVDAVLTITLLNKEKETHYIKGRFEYTPQIDYENFYRYYRTTFERVYTPGYFLVNTSYFWESNFYDLESGQLLYSAQSQSFDPASTEKLSHEYGQMIIKSMVKNKVMRDQKNLTPLKPM